MIKISIWIRHSHTTYELPETNSLHLQKDGIHPQKNVDFHGRLAVSFREGNLESWLEGV